MMLDLRVLNYFLAVAREESITRAAESLHLSQPTLSRQLREMEESLGRPLMVRGARRITLTDDGLLLKKRAEELLSLAQKAESELTGSLETLAGDVYIGSGEAASVHFLTQTARLLQERHPSVRFHIKSGDAAPLLELLDKGLLDFAVIYGHVDAEKYEMLACPTEDRWGALLRRDSPLAALESIAAQDLGDVPLILSRQTLEKNSHADRLQIWLQKPLTDLHIAATYNLAYNAAWLVRDGMGCCLTLEKLINTEGDDELCFRPLSPPLADRLRIVWKKYQVFSRAAREFLSLLQKRAQEETSAASF